MVRVNKRKFKLNKKPVTRQISNKLDILIKRKQKELQLKENINFGRRAQTVTFQYASDKLASEVVRR